MMKNGKQKIAPAGRLVMGLTVLVIWLWPVLPWHTMVVKETGSQAIGGLLPRQAERVKRTGRLAQAALTEASGMAASTLQPDLFWYVNDSGGRPLLFAGDSAGRDLGQVFLVGAENRDWEDLAAFRQEGRSYLLIADVGDNRRRRHFYRLYVVAEPDLRMTQAKVAWSIDFVYPDGPHDCEAVAVDTRQGLVLLLTKRDRPPLLFSLPLATGESETPVTAELLGGVPNLPGPSSSDLLKRFGQYRSQPTAMDISRDGRMAAVLTYKDAYLFSKKRSQTWAEAFVRQPVTLPLPLPEDNPGLEQREAACLDAGGRHLYVTSEGRGATILQVSLETGPAPDP